MTEKTSRSYLPEDWKDDVRMNAMFREFRPKALNPFGWQDQMDFWVSAITNFCHSTKNVVVTEKDIRHAFDRNGSLPRCIDVVLPYMQENGQITTKSRFETTHSTWTTWCKSMITNTLFLPYTSLQSYFSEPPAENYVVLNTLNKMATEVLQQRKCLSASDKSKTKGTVLSRDKFYQDYASICGSKDNAMLVLEVLKDMGEVALLFVKDNEVIIKFKDDDNPEEEKKPAAITEGDRAKLKLQNAIDSIEEELNAHEQGIEELQKSIKACVLTNKPKAMMLLKKKKKLEGVFTKKELTLYNLEKLYEQLKNSASDKMVIDAYKMATAALNTSFRKDLNLDKVDDVVNSLSQAMDDVEEVQRTLASTSVGGLIDDDGELEAELKNLLEEEEEETSPVVAPHKSKAPAHHIDDEEFLKELEELELISDSPGKNRLDETACLP